jgi:uncharacterized protein YjbJ (UPF0337 family)
METGLLADHALAYARRAAKLLLNLPKESRCAARTCSCCRAARLIAKEAVMNADVMEGKWKQMRGQMKEWWGKLTEDDFDVIAGKRDQLVGKLQEKYGWAKRDAEDEVARRFRDYDEVARHTPTAGTSRP